MTLKHQNRFLGKTLRVCAEYRRGNEIIPIYEDALPAFAGVLKGRIRQKYQNVVAITGRTGSGKSTLAIRLAYSINPAWCLDANYIYSTEDLKRKLAGRPYSDPVSLFDECSVSLNSNNAMKSEDKTMVVLFDTMRSLGWTSLLCVPSMMSLNKRIREYHVDYMIMCPNKAPLPGYDPRGFAEIYQHVYRDWGEPYYKLRAVTLTKPLTETQQREYDKIKLAHQEKILADFIGSED